ncbi:hypothetical protein Sjap_014131 [Stephania japonica]|uniref:SAC domain-containing protein n=1 Tax=Stephania japonica TaxID=461633 RepID=A0AAP0IZC9_9MAGN
MSEERFKLLDQMELQEFQDKYVIKSTESPLQSFSIGRSDGEIQALTDDSSSETPNKVTVIYGVIGTIRLLAGTYLLVITSRKNVGTYLGFPVFRVMSMKFIACNETLSRSLRLRADFETGYGFEQKRDEAYFMSLLKTVESTPGLYYSYETDLTINLQRATKLADGRVGKSLWKQADPRFVWNRNLLEELIENKTAEFTLKDLPAKITLISRRCTRRLGTRMWRRGANLEGDTANFIESEQILEFEGFNSSFLQPNVVERHFCDLSQRYGEIVAVDLTDKHGDEGQLSMAYGAELQRLPRIRYVPFDFHHLCGNSNFDNLQLLYNQISDDIEKQGYFLVDSQGEILAEQKGVFRVNCIDCLDRTNVTQMLRKVLLWLSVGKCLVFSTESYLAQKSLDSQLRRLDALSCDESISTSSDIYENFKILWAEQGDEISLEYSGTSALKGDLVRYGRQTLSGLIKDGLSALSRYYLNNFQDVGRNAHQFLSSVIWAGLTAGAFAVVKANGRQFCSRPRLCGLL